jgi:hypothetical protein
VLKHVGDDGGGITTTAHRQLRGVHVRKGGLLPVALDRSKHSFPNIHELLHVGKHELEVRSPDARQMIRLPGT